jgi:hypothetical protein
MELHTAQYRAQGQDLSATGGLFAYVRAGVQGVVPRRSRHPGGQRQRPRHWHLTHPVLPHVHPSLVSHSDHSSTHHTAPFPPLPAGAPATRAALTFGAVKGGGSG